MKKMIGLLAVIIIGIMGWKEPHQEPVAPPSLVSAAPKTENSPKPALSISIPKRLELTKLEKLDDAEFFKLEISEAQKELEKMEYCFCETEEVNCIDDSSTESDYAMEGAKYISYLTSAKWEDTLKAADKTFSLSVYDFDTSTKEKLDSNLNFRLQEELVDSEGSVVASAGEEIPTQTPESFNKTEEDSRQDLGPRMCLTRVKSCSSNSIRTLGEAELLEYLSPKKVVQYLIEREKLYNYIENPEQNGSNKYDEEYYQRKLKELESLE